MGEALSCPRSRPTAPPRHPGGQDWQEVEAFLNDHTRDIDILADRDDCPITDIRLKIDKESMERVCWRRVPYSMMIFQSDFDHLRVMERLAA